MAEPSSLDCELKLITWCGVIVLILISRHVLSAAHCFCRDGDNSGVECKTVKKEGKRTSQPVYPVGRFVNVVVGVNNLKITEAVVKK